MTKFQYSVGVCGPINTFNNLIKCISLIFPLAVSAELIMVNKIIKNNVTAHFVVRTWLLFKDEMISHGFINKKFELN